MSLAVCHSRAQAGIEAPAVSVEVHLANGLPALNIVGLPEPAVKESKDRVRAALLNARFQFPARRITVNLAPADLPKEGGRFDLPIAVGILCASRQLPNNALRAHELVGELGLGGELRPVRGALPIALQAARAGRTLIVPQANAAEAALAEGAVVLGAEHLLGVCDHLAGRQSLPQCPATASARAPGEERGDLGDVRGQQRAKRALEIAAAGAHNILMVGPPGTGKSMLASRLPSILPPMTYAEALESAAVTSVGVAGFDPANWHRRPFRSPHHTASGVALVGGGSHPRPGEISLAHRGVLFLDELTEFDRRVLEVLREPLETGRITISRAARQAEFPARFQLIGAMNPCPQGYDCDLSERCTCTQEQQRRHQARISAPLLDRIDLHIEVLRLPREALRETSAAEESSEAVRARVVAARAMQLERLGKANAEMTSREVEANCRVPAQAHALLDRAMTRFGLSARAYHRVLKVARTVADLAASAEIDTVHLSEAISYRARERAIAA